MTTPGNIAALSCWCIETAGGTMADPHCPRHTAVRLQRRIDILSAALKRVVEHVGDVGMHPEVMKQARDALDEGAR